MMELHPNESFLPFESDLKFKLLGYALLLAPYVAGVMNSLSFPRVLVKHGKVNQYIKGACDANPSFVTRATKNN
jgi:hypothetical protein